VARAELWLIRPEVIVCLGVTAARSVLQRRVPIGASRGEALTGGLPAILRVPDPENREAEEHRFVDDLRLAARVVHGAVRAREEETTR